VRALALSLLLALAPLVVGAVELNTATQAELEQLKGVGVSLSERLLAAREKRPFSDWTDLIARVPGIGPAQAARLSAAGLRIGDQPYTKPAKQSP